MEEIEQKSQFNKDFPQIVINGHVVVGLEVTDVIQMVFYQLDVKNSPMITLHENIQAIKDILYDYLDACIPFLKGTERAKYTRWKNKIVALCDRWCKITDREKLISTYYDFVLLQQDLGTLHGFHVTDKFGDVYYGDPEKISINKVRPRL